MGNFGAGLMDVLRFLYPSDDTIMSWNAVGRVVGVVLVVTIWRAIGYGFISLCEWVFV